MEIVLPQKYNLESAIDSTWSDWVDSQKKAKQNQELAIEQAKTFLKTQFQEHLNEAIKPQMQVALGLQISEPNNLETIIATFDYMGVAFTLSRAWLAGQFFWQLAYDGQCLHCLPEVLHKQILLELGKIKNRNGTT